MNRPAQHCLQPPRQRRSAASASSRLHSSGHILSLASQQAHVPAAGSAPPGAKRGHSSRRGASRSVQANVSCKAGQHPSPRTTRLQSCKRGNPQLHTLQVQPQPHTRHITPQLPHHTMHQPKAPNTCTARHHNSSWRSTIPCALHTRSPPPAVPPLHLSPSACPSAPPPGRCSAS
jgi:hypothetical protein